MAKDPVAKDDFESQTYLKVTWRLLPFIGVCYFVAYLDRVNVGFAKLQMLSDLKLSEAAYGFGAGVFFVGYFLFEVPSNLLCTAWVRGLGSLGSWSRGGSYLEPWPSLGLWPMR